MNEIESSVEDSEPSSLEFSMPSRKDLGWLAFGGGVVGAVVNLLARRRGIVDWLLPVSFMGLGAGVLLLRRQGQMQAAEDNILAELDALDPIARAQVLEAVAREQVGRLTESP